MSGISDSKRGVRMNKYLNGTLAIDGSYMIHRCLKTPDLWELRNKRGERTGGIYGFFRCFQFAMKECDYFPVICWDCGQSPRRLELYPNYKHHMDKAIIRKAEQYALMLLNREIENLPSDVTLEERKAVEEAMKKFMEVRQKHGSYVDPDDYVSQYKRQRDLVISICHSLGVPSILVSHWEGDDLITLLTRISKKAIVVTDDRDMIQLLSPDVSIYRAMAKEHLEYSSYLKANNANSSREFAIAKAISGDPSDNISSVTDMETERKYRVGEKTALRIAKVISDNREDRQAYTKALLEITDKDRNKIQGFIRNLPIYERNMKLVDLSLVENDLQVINGIIAEVKANSGNPKFFDVLSKLGELDITTVDVNSLIASLTARYRQSFGE